MGMERGLQMNRNRPQDQAEHMDPLAAERVAVALVVGHGEVQAVVEEVVAVVTLLTEDPVMEEEVEEVIVRVFQRKNVPQYNNNVEMYQDNSVEPLTSSNVKMFPDNNARVCPNRSAQMSHNRNVKMSLNKNVEMFLSKSAAMYLCKNVRMFQDNNAEAYQNNSVGMYLNRNA